jgi:hypothetical protein
MSKRTCLAALAALAVVLSSACGDDGAGNTDADDAAVDDAGGDVETTDGTDGGADATGDGDAPDDGADAADDGYVLPTGTLTVFTGPSGTPANAPFLAFRDGDGPWQVATGTAGVYELDCTTGRYGILILGGRLPRTIEVVYATMADADTLSFVGEPMSVSGGTSTIQGAVSGIGAGEGLTLCASGDHERVDVRPGPIGASYAWILPEGRYTLTALRTLGTAALQALRAGPLDALPGGTVDQNLAFDAAAPATLERTVVLAGLDAGETWELSSELLSRANTGCPISSTTSADTVRVLPESVLTPTEIHRIRLAAVDPSVEDRRVAVVHSRGASGTTLDPPPRPSTVAVVSAVSTSPVLLGVQFQPQAWVEQHRLSVDRQGTMLEWVVSATAGWLGGADHLEMPDLSAVAGWVPAANLLSGTPLAWNYQALATTSGPPMPRHEAGLPPPEGYGERSIERDGSLTVGP